jgi:hypothetical protein
MDRRGHYFLNGGPCVWCKVTPSRVDDRRAAPFCEERPDAYDYDDDARNTANEATGY